MKKAVYFVCFLLIAALFSVKDIKAATLAWGPVTPPAGSTIFGYRVWYGNTTQLFFDNKDVGNTTAFVLDNFTGLWFFVVTAYNQEGNSGFSREIAVLFDENGRMTKATVNAVVYADGVDLSWPEVPDMLGYKIDYGNELAVGNVNVTEYFLQLPPGIYDVNVIPISNLGNEQIYLFETVRVVIDEPAIEKPAVGIESVGVGGPRYQNVITAFSSDDPRVDAYRISYSSTYAAAIADAGDLVSPAVFEGDNRCEVFDTLTRHMVFVTVTALDYDSGLESEPAVAYVLFGNLVGTYNDGTPWDLAKVEKADLDVYPVYSGQIFERPDYCNASDVFGLLPFSTKERADASGDGKVNLVDLNYIRSKYGKTGAMFAG